MKFLVERLGLKVSGPLSKAEIDSLLERARSALESGGTWPGGLWQVWISPEDRAAELWSWRDDISDSELEAAIADAVRFAGPGIRAEYASRSLTAIIDLDLREDLAVIDAWPDQSAEA